MATVGTRLNYLDIVKRLQPDGSLDDIGEILNLEILMLADFDFTEGNQTFGEHRFTQRTSLPSPTDVGYNQRVTDTKSTAAQLEEGIGKKEAWYSIDARLVDDLGGDARKLLDDESKAHVEGMAQDIATDLIYGNKNLNPLKITGLAPRFNNLSGENAKNIFNCGAAGSDNTSIWLVGHGPRKVFGIYPKGTVAGIRRETLGRRVSETTDGKMIVVEEKIYWCGGIVVQDWRYVVRACNIDVSVIKARDNTDADWITLPDLLGDMRRRLPNLQAIRPVFYMNQTMLSELEWQAKNEVKGGGGLTVENYGGFDVDMFRKIPIKQCDAITETETLVS